MGPKGGAVLVPVLDRNDDEARLVEGGRGAPNDPLRRDVVVVGSDGVRTLVVVEVLGVIGPAVVLLPTECRRACLR